MLTTYNTNNNLKAYYTDYNKDKPLLAPQMANMYVVVSKQEIRSFMVFLKLNSLLRISNAIDITVDNVNKEPHFNITT